MPRRQVDPARLYGDELKRWYERSPLEIEQERLAAESDRRAAFAAGSRQELSTTQLADPEALSGARSSDETLWMVNGRGGYRPIGPRNGTFPRMPESVDETETPFGLPNNPATMEAAELALVGNPYNRKGIREWEIANGRSWPTTETGEKYHVSHKKALADGGTNTLDNIEPVHPDRHIAAHRENGDYGRWAKRQWIAKAFGGTVARGLGPLSILSNITGILSGRIRMDNFDNFSSDMLGLPSEEDQRKAFEAHQKLINPKWKPGDPFGV